MQHDIICHGSCLSVQAQGQELSLPKEGSMSLSGQDNKPPEGQSLNCNGAGGCLEWYRAPCVLGPQLTDISHQLECTVVQAQTTP